MNDTSLIRPHKLDSQFIVTTFHFFDEGARSIFNIQYQYLDRGGRGLVFCSRFPAGRLLQKGHQKQQHWDVISIFTIWQETSDKKHQQGVRTLLS